MWPEGKLPFSCNKDEVNPEKESNLHHHLDYNIHNIQTSLETPKFS